VREAKVRTTRFGWGSAQAGRFRGRRQRREALLAEGLVTVAGRLETRRRRQLRHGGVVAVGDEKVRLV
jgi:hypothetical protein